MSGKSSLYRWFMPNTPLTRVEKIKKAQVKYISTWRIEDDLRHDVSRLKVKSRSCTTKFRAGATLAIGPLTVGH
ncbi:MAG: hypothetical protein HC917_09615 [Richelia sp. SM2_1_7]|nr:hypothetical protein [Richelia sp. SM2_1_7]